MTEFSSAQEMLEQLIIPKIEELRDPLKSEDENLKITTTWLINKGEELVVVHEKLGIPFKNMHIIVNTSFFNPWELLRQYDEAYHELSKNAKWESIDALVKRGEEVLVNPIAFISLISCFKGRGNRQINLSDILNHLNYASSEKRLLVTLSSEEDEQKKKIEIEKAKNLIMSRNKDVNIGEFEISDEGGGYCGFWVSF